MTAQTPPVKNALDRVDELLSLLAAKQSEILAVLAESTAKHQVIDAEYAPRLNPIYRETWESFLELKALFDAHPEMVPRGKRSAQRGTGTVGLRSKSEINLQVEMPEIVRRIRTLGQAASRKLLRRVIVWELRISNIKAPENAALVAQVDGLEVAKSDDFFAKPNHGFRMSTALPYWPTLEGVTGSRAFEVMFAPEDT
ncbi:MAG TPA: hypothetical protein VGH44_03495 [Candidatus Saccharimonadia bacterium]|jgi:hypothetical protein